MKQKDLKGTGETVWFIPFDENGCHFPALELSDGKTCLTESIPGVNKRALDKMMRIAKNIVNKKNYLSSKG